MAISNVTPASFINAAFAAHYAAVDAAQTPFVDAALASNNEAAYRAAMAFDTATPLERLAFTWLRAAMRDKVTGADFDRWVMMYSNALGEATDSERELLELADCAMESALGCLH
jgi:hypothetical protein